jgi:hypothetical protein
MSSRAQERLPAALGKVNLKSLPTLAVALDPRASRG